MAARYQKSFAVPDGFPALLKSFTREILRAQPDNIYEFGARYFAQLVEAREAEMDAAAETNAPRSLFEMDNEELQEFCLELFMQFDADQSGYLDRSEFKKCLQSAEMGLSKKDIRRIMSEADENDDGVLEYREFLPVMVMIVHSLKAKEEAAMAREEAEEAARAEVENVLLHGMPREELEAMMGSVFEKADDDGNGTLSRAEFKRCLMSADLGLTKKDINLLLSECDLDGDGKISYSEFVPLCFNILVERFTEEVIAEEALQSSDGLTQLLLQEFEAADTDGAGKLKQKEVKSVLGALSKDLLGLSRLQILSLMSEALPDGDGMVDYTKFAAPCATMIYSFVDQDSQQQRLKAIATMAESEGAQLLKGLSSDTVKQVLMAAFEEADADKSGTLDRMEVMNVLMAMGAGELALKPAEINALMAAVDDNEDGVVSYRELVEFLYDVLVHLEREDVIQETAFNRHMADLFV
eukprot:CAMPEP_0170134698 /NCGR_PEP_ID=MMETSP0033_2-20121228/2054_1 /TAXON_ID=195969 /ORGANISM="Dolichomastix tenuilepis, Strain CCMP3274" /LENGTH=467 /DNA_ID=CAMNT_0010370269 /DNA_START=39 /DNA_END=1442 /DNA_ORIENTATION=-